ncbi:MAG TPA: AraC family transcriptional regulator [Clostridiales bacterium]|nr:AraC family transcriptional regulator [Clostridiales bacterium]
MFSSLKNHRVLSFLLYQCLVSMILVLACTALSSAISYDVLRKKLSAWSIRTNNELIEHYNDVFKVSIVTGSEKIYDQTLLALYSNSNMKYFLNNPIEKNFLGINSINTYFRNIVKANPLIREVGIFYVTNHLIVTNDTVKYDYFYNFHNHEIAFFISKIEEILDKGDVSNFNAYATDGAIQMIRPLVTANKVIALIFIEYSTDALNEKLKENVTDMFGNLLVLDKQGTVIYDNSSGYSGKHYSQLPIYSDKLNNADRGYYFKNIDKVRSIISHMSDNNSWRYISITPEQFYMEPVQYILKNLIICILVSLLASIIFIVTMSLWQSRSMRSIIELCDKTGENNSIPSKFSDIYGFIRSTLTELMRTVETQTQEIKKLMPILRKNFVLWLMSEKEADAGEVNDTMLLMRVEFPFENFAFLAVKAVYEYINIDAESDEFDPGYALAEASVILKAAFNTNDSIGVFYRNSDYITGLINFSFDSKTLDRRCNTLFKQSFHGFRFYIASGPVASNISELAGMANSTIESLRYSYLFPENKYFSHEFVSRFGKVELNISNELSMFSEAMKRKDSKCTIELLYTIVQKLLHSGCTPQYAQQVMLEASSIIEKFSRPGINEELIHIFGACNDILSLYQALRDIISLEFDFIPIVSNNTLVLINDAKKYIDRNLTSSQLSLQSVSDELNITTQYLSQIFHEVSGITFTEYINSKKMKLACQLLNETNLNITDISEKLCYSSPQYFIRRFKKFYGVTPSSYRHNMKGRLTEEVSEISLLH